MKKPIFNKKWIILQEIGEGNTSKVYKVKSNVSGEIAALKILKMDHLKKITSKCDFQNEIFIMNSLKFHQNVVKILDSGTQGIVDQGNGKYVPGLHYILMEHVEGGLLFELCRKMGGMGEEAGREFMTQILNVLDYMHNVKGYCHRDIKVENILIDHQLNLKLTDFGFAASYEIDNLR